jgi:hypothetical protein
MPMQYINRFIQQCYPILARFIANYKKQVMLIEMKLKQHYIIYYIPSYKQSDLLSTMSGKWP